MAKAPQRTSIPGPAFVRLIARLSEARLPDASPALADRLSEWIDWTRAVALSRALDERLPEAAADAPVFDSIENHEYTRVRAALVKAIATDAAPTSAKRPQTQPQPDHDDYLPFRERYRDLQQSMQAETGRLRGRLRDMLAAGSPQQARLAEVDAVMETTLTPREHALLGAVPALLGQHFQRRRKLSGEVAEPADPVNPQPAVHDAAADAAWMLQFQQDMQHVLLAELDVRFQPVEGLLAALRTR